MISEQEKTPLYICGHYRQYGSVCKNWSLDPQCRSVRSSWGVYKTIGPGLCWLSLWVVITLSSSKIQKRTAGKEKEKKERERREEGKEEEEERKRERKRRGERKEQNNALEERENLNKIFLGKEREEVRSE